MTCDVSPVAMFILIATIKIGLLTTNCGGLSRCTTRTTRGRWTSRRWRTWWWWVFGQRWWWRLLFIVAGLIWFIPVLLDEFKNAHSLTIKWAMHWPNLTINSDDLATVVNSNVGHHQVLAQLLMINLVVVFRRYSTCLKGRGWKPRATQRRKLTTFSSKMIMAVIINEDNLMIIMKRMIIW